MDVNDIIKVHIWQLPEKNNDIIKESEYTMIHDGASLKKVTLERLYEYFNQNYKSEAIINYFESALLSLNDEYQIKYSSLDLSIDEYDKLVKTFQEKFKENRDNIRTIESTINQLDREITELVILDDISGSYLVITSALDNLSNVIGDLKKSVDNSTKEIKILNQDIDTLVKKSSELQVEYTNIDERLKNINSNNDKTLENMTNDFLKNINEKYDKILGIIDYYHHIHDSEI